jgi:transposase
MDELHRSCPPEDDTVRSVEAIGEPAPRRRWTTEEKSQIVAESYAPGASTTAVARRHGLYRNQLVRWRRQFRGAAASETGLPNFVPVAVATPDGEADRIELVSAGVRIRVGSGFDAGELRRVLLVVRGLG